jgi:hypothetical protein
MLPRPQVIREQEGGDDPSESDAGSPRHTSFPLEPSGSYKSSPQVIREQDEGDDPSESDDGSPRHASFPFEPSGSYKSSPQVIREQDEGDDHSESDDGSPRHASFPFEPSGTYWDPSSQSEPSGKYSQDMPSMLQGQQATSTSSETAAIDEEPGMTSLASLHSLQSNKPHLTRGGSLLCGILGLDEQKSNNSSKEYVLANEELHFCDSEIDLDDVSMEQAKFLATPSDRFVVHPNSKGRMVLDMSVLVIILMECVTLPLNIAFSIKLPRPIHYISLVLFVSDMVMSFNTGYHHSDYVIMRRGRITRNYMRTWFVLDFTSLFPWEEVFALLSGGGTGSGGTKTTFVRILKLGKLLRVLRLLRLAKISALIKRLQSNGILPLDLTRLKFGMAIVKLFVIFGLLAHWSACIWGWLGDPDNIGHGSADSDPHPIEICTMGGPCEPGVEGSPWRHRYGLNNYEPVTQYFAALQYCAALITGGESPLTASHPAERCFSIVMMIVSVLVNSSVVGEILLIMNRVAERRMDFDDRMQSAREFMIGRNVPSQFQVRVYRYLETQHNISTGHSTSNRAFMNELTDMLQKELVLILNSKHLRQHPFFAGIKEMEILERLCLEATPLIYAQGESLVEKGTPADCVHFLVMGKARIENPIMNTSKVLYLKPPCWIGDTCLFVDTLRKSTVTAVVMTETLCINKEGFQALCSESDVFLEQYHEWREMVLNDKMDALMCPVCHDIGHSEEGCPNKHHH